MPRVQCDDGSVVHQVAATPNFPKPVREGLGDSLQTITQRDHNQVGPGQPEGTRIPSPTPLRLLQVRDDCPGVP
jgi:hypothetical protein